MNVGDKFVLDLSDDDDPARDDVTSSKQPSLFSFVGDIQERQPTTILPPSEPRLKNKTGFPAHTKRSTFSRFKQKRNDDSTTTSSAAIHDHPIVMTEKQQIDKENKDRLASMSTDEIEEARRELMSSLDPVILKNLMLKANISDGSNEAVDWQGNDSNAQPSEHQHDQRSKRVAFKDDSSNDDVVRAENQKQDTLPTDSIHFPRAPQPPDLDPNSETFLEDLHSKFFPSLPAEPDKLEWMRKSNKTKNSYDPAQSTLNPGEIRFDFKGGLIAPSRAAQIPVSEGLHHHGDAPEAAGYTIPELAHLSRSTYAPQRCIAFQTLGRLLFKLGSGEYGDPGEPGADTVGAENTMGELARGLWSQIEAQHVIEQLVAESEGNGVDGGRHVSAKAYAIEAVWLWRKGGGRRWKAT